MVGIWKKAGRLANDMPIVFLLYISQRDEDKTIHNNNNSNREWEHYNGAKMAPICIVIRRKSDARYHVITLYDMVVLWQYKLL